MKSKPLLAVLLSLGLFLALSSSLVHLSNKAQAWAPALQGGVSLQAAVGTGFTYQGRLTDGGSPANGTYDFEFKLYDAASVGSLIGTATQDDVAVSNGLFNVVLDFGSGAFNGEARWLEVGVGEGLRALPERTYLLEGEDVTLRANTWITDLALDQSTHQISFRTHGPPEGTVQVSVVIPKELLAGPFTLSVDGQPHDSSTSEDAAHTTLRFEFGQGPHQVVVIGEYEPGSLTTSKHNLRGGAQ